MPDEPSPPVLSTHGAAFFWKGGSRRLAAVCALLSLPAWVLSPLSFGATTGLVAAAFALSLASGSVRARKPGTISVEGDDLVFTTREGRRYTRPRVMAMSGWYELTADGVDVVVTFAEGALRYDGDVFKARVADVATARRVLDLAGVGVRQRTWLVETRSTFRRLVWFFGAFAMGFLALALSLLTLFAFVVYPWAGVMLLIPLVVSALLTVVMLQPVDAMEVVVGADGLSIRGEVSDRFIPHRIIDRVETQGRALVVVLKDGSRVEVAGPSLGYRQRDALRRRLVDAMTEQATADATERTRAMLAMGNRTFEAWRASLRALVRADGVYRQNTVHGAEMVQVLDDPTAPPEQRVAAAMVLAALDEQRDHVRTRVRVAAEATASEPLRGALERVLDDALDERSWTRIQRALRRST